MKKLLFLVLLLAGCNPARDFAIVDVDVRLAGLTGVRGEAVVRNDGRRSLTVERAEFTLRIEGQKVARAVLVEPVSVPAREVSKVDFRLRLTDVSLGAAGALDRATVDVDGEVKLGERRKKIRLKNVPFSQILSTFTEDRMRFGNLCK